MTKRHVLMASAAIAASVLLAIPAAQASDCVRTGVSAVAVTKELSSMLATESLKATMALEGRSGRGATSVSCKYVGIVTDCTARQVACK